MVVLAAAGCSSGRPRTAGSALGGSTALSEHVVATAPPVVPGSRDCGTTDSIYGWPTTTTTPPDGYACIVDALAAGTPAQMTAIEPGTGRSGRTTRDGYELPTRRITTWRVRARRDVQEITDLTEDGGRSTTRTCTGLVAPVGSIPRATGCS